MLKQIVTLLSIFSSASKFQNIIMYNEHDWDQPSSSSSKIKVTFALMALMNEMEPWKLVDFCCSIHSKLSSLFLFSYRTDWSLFYIPFIVIAAFSIAGPTSAKLASSTSLNYYSPLRMDEVSFLKNSLLLSISIGFDHMYTWCTNSFSLLFVYTINK